MKRSILCLALLTLGFGLAASNRVDDPPPEPVDCPMCGGNANLHARRLILVEEQVIVVALVTTRW